MAWSILPNITESAGSAKPEPRSEIEARKFVDGVETRVPAQSLSKNQTVVCEANDVIPANGIILEGMAVIDESPITGESVPVIRESGKDSGVVIGETKVLSGRIVVRVIDVHSNDAYGRFASLVRNLNHEMTDDDRRMAVPLWFLVVSISTLFICLPFLTSLGNKAQDLFSEKMALVPVMITLWLSLIPFTIAGMMSIIEVAELRQLFKKNIIPPSIKAVERAGSIDKILIDKGHDLAFDNPNFSRLMVEVNSDDKLSTIRRERASGHVVAVLEGGTNDSALFSRAEVCFALSTYVRRENRSGNVINIGSHPGKIIDVIESGKRISMIRRSVTIFAFFNVLVGCFAVIPALIGIIFQTGINSVAVPNILNLASPQSAILSVALLNLFVYSLLAVFILKKSDRIFSNRINNFLFSPAFSGLAGLIAPIVALKILDIIVNALRLI